MMNILVLNCGSSSVKYQLIEAEARKTLTKGSVERIGMSGATLTNRRHDGDEIRIAGEIVDHTVAIEYILAVLLSRNHGVITDKSRHPRDRSPGGARRRDVLGFGAHHRRGDQAPSGTTSSSRRCTIPTTCGGSPRAK